MTTDLDRFSPRAWQEKGVMSLAPVRKPRLQKRTVKPLVAAVVLSVACVAVSSAADARLREGFSSATHVFAQRSVPVTGTSAELGFSGDFISPSSWPELMAALESAPDVQDADGPDPEPEI